MEYIKKIKYLLFVFTTIFVASCATTKEIEVNKKIKYISENKLYNNVIDSTLNYSGLYFKKFSVNINNNGKKNNYKGVMKIQKDSAIWISMTAPLGIEVVRIIITKDSIKLVDRYNKQYFTGNFDYISSKFNNDFDYYTIQSIITNELFEFPKYDNKPFTRNFKYKIKNGKYVFFTFNERKIEKKNKRVERQNKKNKDLSIIYQANYIDPDNFRITEVIIDELSKDWKFNIKYDDFKKVEGQLFPMKINFCIEFGDSTFNCNISFNKLDFKEKVKLSFKIPSNYKKIE